MNFNHQNKLKQKKRINDPLFKKLRIKILLFNKF